MRDEIIEAVRDLSKDDLETVRAIFELPNSSRNTIRNYALEDEDIAECILTQF